MKRWKAHVLRRLHDAFKSVGFMRSVNILVGEASYYADYYDDDFSYDDSFGGYHQCDNGGYIAVRLPYEMTGEDEEIIAVGEQGFFEFLCRNFTVREILDMQLIEFNPYF